MYLEGGNTPTRVQWFSKERDYRVNANLELLAYCNVMVSMDSVWYVASPFPMKLDAVIPAPADLTVSLTLTSAAKPWC